MTKNTIILFYVGAVALVIALIIYYRKNILTDKFNNAMDNLFESNYTKSYLANANSMYNSAVISNNFLGTCKTFYNKAVANKATYQRIANAVNSAIPWYFIAVLHNRESDCNFNTHLYNGDSLKARTVNAPNGLPKAAPKNGVSYTFEESAIDTLFNKGLNKWTDFSIAGMIYCSERYNGWGYAWRKKISPYVWSGTQHYKGGKFVTDHIFSDTAIDKQVGTVALLKYFLTHNI
jgi:lysozyme family protein